MKSREDYLYARLEQLEDAGLDKTDEYRRVEVELDAIANSRSIAQKKAAEQEALMAHRKAQIAAAISVGDVTLTLRLGAHEFVDDYEVCQEGTDWVVYSKVANEHQDARHVCSSQEEARRRLDQLIYYRIYDTYTRDR